MVRLETVIVVVALAEDTLPSAVKVIVVVGLSVTPLGAVMVKGGVPPTGLGSAVSHAELVPGAEA